MEPVATLGQQQLDRLLAASQALVRVLDLEAVLAHLLDAARELTGAQYAAIGILDERRERFGRFVATGMSEGEQQALGPPPVGGGVFGTVITALEPVRIPDISAHPDSTGFPDGHPPMTSFLGVPVMLHGEAWGVIYCAEHPEGEFTEEHQRLLVLLAGWATVAVENAGLYEQGERDRRELERALRAYRATREVALAIGSDLELDHALELIARRGRPLVSADTLVMLLSDGARHEAVAWDGERAAGETTALTVDPAAAPAAAWRALGVPAPEAVLIVPMIYRGTPIGTLAAFRSGEAPFTADDRELLESYAVSAATRVMLARSVQRERLQDAVAAADAERRRWARELHDQTLQGLAAIRLTLSTAAPDGAPDAARDAIALIDEEIASLRAIIADLRPVSLDELGWDAALLALIERGRAGDDLDIALSVTGDPAAEPRERQAAAFRIVQEALTNVRRHADARHVTVAIDAGETFTITVTDDGRGFDPGAPTAGLGLVGMRERVELAGGTLALTSGASGTTVRVELAGK